MSKKMYYQVGEMNPDVGWTGTSGVGFVNNFVPINGGYSMGPYMERLGTPTNDIQGALHGEILGSILYADDSDVVLHMAIGGGDRGYKVFACEIGGINVNGSDTEFLASNVTPSGGTWTDPQPSYQEYSDTFGVQMCVFNTDVYITNGKDLIHKREGHLTNPSTLYAAISPSTGATTDLRARLIRSHQGHLFAANISLPNTAHGGVGIGVHENLIWWSAFDNPQTFGSLATTPEHRGTDYKFLYDTPGGVTALVPAGDVIFAFKEKAIYLGEGPPFRWNLLSSSIGTQFPNSAEYFNNGVYFMSDSGPAYIGRDGEIILLLQGKSQRALVGTSTSFSE